LKTAFYADWVVKLKEFLIHTLLQLGGCGQLTVS